MKQGDIYRVNLEPTIGAEIKKTRPALIINDNALGKLPLKVIVPVTDWKDHYSDYPWMIKIEPDNNNGLIKPSAIDCFQIRSISVNRFMEYLGFVISDKIDEVKNAITKVIGLN
jgi:mRNA interferase MazF